MTGPRFAPREAKAHKIRQVLLDFLGPVGLQRASCLDIGCGNGEIASSLVDLFGSTIGLDRSAELVREGRKSWSRLDLLQGDGIRLPFRDGSFDIVLCAQVYEHVANAEHLPAEVERVLRPGGLCFFSGPNKVWPIEPHYRLPFLHWLPTRLADGYLRASRRGDAFDIRPFTAWRLRHLWRRFARHDYTIRMIREPERFGLTMPSLRVVRRVPVPVLNALYDLLPNYNWILVKPDAQSIH